MANCRCIGNNGSPLNGQPQQTAPIQTVQTQEEMPMNRYINPIPLCGQQERDGQDLGEERELLEAQTQILLRILDRLERLLDQANT